jgi:hypothetical protein
MMDGKTRQNENGSGALTGELYPDLRRPREQILHSMRQQHRQRRAGENVLRGPPEDHLAQSALGVGAFDDEITTEHLRLCQ